MRCCHLSLNVRLQMVVDEYLRCLAVVERLLHGMQSVCLVEVEAYHKVCFVESLAYLLGMLVVAYDALASRHPLQEVGICIG